ncbi:MAG: hypothetical protein LBT38_04595 [Deltaproteobacteria bacterium]|jgi:hypothetical protein|nr:hypothetical protein [Deltaproteobacteria bacterium]
MVTLKPLSHLYLWRLASNNSVGWLKDLKPALTPSDRKILLSQGLIEENLAKPDRPKARPAKQISLTEKGWDYLATNVSAPVNARSYCGSEIFGEFLVHLAKFLHDRSLTLSDIFIAGSGPTTSPDPIDPTLTVKERLDSLRQGAAFPLLIFLKDFRASLPPSLSADQATKALLELNAQGYLKLKSLSDDPSAYNQDDEKAAIMLAGTPRHVIVIFS